MLEDSRRAIRGRAPRFAGAAAAWSCSRQSGRIRSARQFAPQPRSAEDESEVCSAVLSARPRGRSLAINLADVTGDESALIAATRVDSSWIDDARYGLGLSLAQWQRSEALSSFRDARDGDVDSHRVTSALGSVRSMASTPVGRRFTNAYRRQRPKHAATVGHAELTSQGQRRVC